jgi:uncharacterized protein (TIGR02246 family)
MAGDHSRNPLDALGRNEEVVRPEKDEVSNAGAVAQQSVSQESQIKALIEAWADAVRRHDLAGTLAHHEQDIVMFDVPPPLQSRGMNEYRKTWDLFFEYHQPSQAFDIEELTITAGADIAFAVAIMRCGPGVSAPFGEDLLFRLTIGLRKVDGDWRIAHEHHSVPSTN